MQSRFASFGVGGAEELQQQRTRAATVEQLRDLCGMHALHIENKTRRRCQQASHSALDCRPGAANRLETSL